MTITKTSLFRFMALSLVLLALIAFSIALAGMPDGVRAMDVSPGGIQAISPTQWAAIQGAQQLLLSDTTVMIYLPVIRR